MSEWISVKDRLPKKGECVLCFYDSQLHKHIDPFGRSNRIVTRELIAENGMEWANEGVTHWMPLPEPPQE